MNIKQWLCGILKRHKYVRYNLRTEFGDGLTLVATYQKCMRCGKAINVISEVIELHTEVKKSGKGKKAKK